MAIERDRGIFQVAQILPMKSTVRVLDGMADGKCAVAEQVLQIKTGPYGSVEQ